MIQVTFFHPLGPALILALGGLAIRWGRGLKRRFGSVPMDAARRATGSGANRPLGTLSLTAGNIVALVSVGVATFLLAWLRRHPAVSVLHWGWQPLTVAGSALDWRFDAWSWVVALILLILVAVVLLLRPLDTGTVGSDDTDERTLWLGAAALTFVFSGNVVTLASAWILLDAALAYRLHPDRTVAPAARLWGASSLTALLLFGVFCLMGERGSRTLLTSGPFSTVQIGLLWFLGLVRAGVYPFHFGMVGGGSLDRGDRVSLHLVAPITGLWLLARVHSASAVEWFRRPEWAALGVLALLGTALAAWMAEDDAWRWRWVATNRAGLVVLAAYAGQFSGAAMVVWPMVTFALGCALLAGLGRAGDGRGWRLAKWLGALALWGIPCTPGFMARSVLVFPTSLPAAAPLFAVIVIAEILLVASLWEMVAPRSETPLQAQSTTSGISMRPAWQVQARMVAAALLLSIPLLVWGLSPKQLAAVSGIAAQDTFSTIVAAVFGARRSVWVSLLLSGVLGVVLGLYRVQILAGMCGWQRAISGFVGLDWLFRTVAAGMALVGSGVRFFAALCEGEGYLGWMALAGLVLWVLLHA